MDRIHYGTLRTFQMVNAYHTAYVHFVINSVQARTRVVPFLVDVVRCVSNIPKQKQYYYIYILLYTMRYAMQGTYIIFITRIVYNRQPRETLRTKIRRTMLTTFFSYF